MEKPVAEGFGRFVSSPRVSEALTKGLTHEIVSQLSDPYSTHPPLPASAAVLAQAPTLRVAVRNALGGSPGRARPVVSFHLDQPYFDLTGLEEPYVPPVGMRSAEPLAALSDEALSRFYGFI